MMLLSAVLMILAFLALSAMVARVAQLGSVTTQDRDRPVLLEVDVVQGAVDETLTGLKATYGFCTGDPKQCRGAFIEALNGSLTHLAAIESGRGFDLGWRFVDSTGTPVTACVAAVVAPATAPVRYVEYTLDDGEVRVSLRSTATFTWAC